MENEESKIKTLKKRFLNTKSLLVGGLALGLALFLFTQKQAELKHAAALAAAAVKEQKDFEANTKFGLDYRLFEELKYTLQSGDALGPLLIKQGLNHEQVLKIVENAKDVFNIGSFRAGKDVHFLFEKDEHTPRHFIYEPSPYRYLTIQLDEPFAVTMTERPVTTKVAEASGILESSFWQAMTDNGLTYEVADAIVGVLESSVDFYHQQVGDRFKVVYEQKIVDGEVVGMGEIHAALYERGEDRSYAFHFEAEGEQNQYFDEEGRPARKAFLRAPVKFSRISSRFNRNRFHPVLRRRRAHLGTDYAAPRGTPIIAVAAGTITEATRRGGNGKFVKIRHDKTYETQYLHMSRFAKGMKPGNMVAKGDVIGYVGSTGLATGPHVCFRFWKNGRQVDFLKQKLPSPKPMRPENLEKFQAVRDSLMEKLNAVPYRTQEEIFKQNAEELKEKKVNP